MRSVGCVCVCVREWLSPLSYSTTQQHLPQLHLISPIRFYEAALSLSGFITGQPYLLLHTEPISSFSLSQHKVQEKL